MKASKKREISHWIERTRTRDPRIGVTTDPITEVWKGQLDEFYEGWRRVRPPGITA